MDGIDPLAFTPRFCYPTIPLQEEFFASPTGQFSHELAHGEDPDLAVHDVSRVGIRVALRPFPFDDETTDEETSCDAAVVIETDGREGIHTGDAQTVAGPWRVAGESGMRFVVTGMGETMQEAREQCDGRVEDGVIPNRYHRGDGGERWIDGDGDRQQAWGSLEPAG